MVLQIFIGSILIIISVVIQVTFIDTTIRVLQRTYTKSEHLNPKLFEFVFTLSAITLWLLIALSVIIWMWAFVMLGLGIFGDVEESVYFSLVSFTTLGFGDIILPKEWRILSGFIAANGFVIFGLNTAVLIEAITKLRTVPKSAPDI